MKKYSKPEIAYLEIRSEECLAAVCEEPGECNAPVPGYPQYWGRS